LVVLSAVALARGHGQMNYPPSSRQGLPGKTWPGALTGQGGGGYCEQPNSEGRGNPLNGACMMFSQPSAQRPEISVIPGWPTNNASSTRTHNVNISDGSVNDWTKKMPWRAPGSAPVLGSGCGVAGGGDTFNGNGGWPPSGMTQGANALELPAGRATVWSRGSVVEVAWGMWANHGGGYSYRICPNGPGDKITEECFQQHPLDFAGDVQWMQHLNGSKYQIPMTKVGTGTSPAGSQWARQPVPGCKDNHGFKDDCGADGTEYPAPLPGLQGFGYVNSTKQGDLYHDFSIVDTVVVPKDVAPGAYLVSWRWDCEQTTQIWQNCADIVIV